MNSIYLFGVLLPIYLLFNVGLAGIFKKAGQSPLLAFVPIVNLAIWTKALNRPVWWFLLLFVPVVGFIIQITLCIDTVKAFGKNKFYSHAAAVILAPIYFIYLGFGAKNKFDIEGVSKGEKKTESREWADAILFAGGAALLIRTFFLEAFMIPTTSMEGSLLAGDFLFVSKFHYGVRLPMVPLSLPFIHNRIPGTNMKSYLPFPYLPYSRLPAIRKIKRNDIVVFNYPENDAKADVGETHKYKEVSMKQNYIKRCVALPGDSFEVRNRQVYINSVPGWTSPNAQFAYIVVTNGMVLNKTYLKKNGFRLYDEKTEPRNFNVLDLRSNHHYQFWMSESKAAAVAKWPGVTSVTAGQSEMFQHDPGTFYPHDPSHFRNDQDNWGPVKIPAKGATVTLNNDNISLYRRLIVSYEGHTLDESQNPFLIDGKPSPTYTFGMDYYFMMGDNRHQSADGRFWGFVPEDHVVGRPWMVVLSIEDGVRWDRLFKPVTTWEE